MIEGNMMRIHITKKQKISFMLLSLFSLIYIGLSSLLGFPLGFGTMMARGITENYCEAVYPQAAMGKTVFNPVSNSFETVIYLGDETLYIRSRPNQSAVNDNYREGLFLQETGVTETVSRLHRTYVSGQYYRFVACYVYWNYDDPMTPITNLRFDYGDYETSKLPNDEQIKQLLAPIALDCILQVEEHLTLNKVELLYYHPDFNPDENGMTWRIMEIPLTDETQRTEKLLDGAQLQID